MAFRALLIGDGDPNIWANRGRGQAGDYYLDILTGDKYGPKGADWPLVGPIIAGGAQGPQGPQGVQGDAGAPGPTGSQPPLGTTPSTQAFGDAATGGAATDAAKTDHKHAMPANPVTAHEAASNPHDGYVLNAAVPGGELGGSYAVPTVDATHAGSTHASAQSAAEATAQAALDAHTSDTVDAHDASAISILDTANDFTATDVEGALAEIQADNEAHVAAANPHAVYRLVSVAIAAADVAADVATQAELDAHISDSSAAHAASAIGFTPNGSIAATDVQAAIQEVRDEAGGSPIGAWPIGSVFIAVVSTSPATLLGGGTWVAFGTGRMLVGLDSGDTDFDVAEETGGAKTVTLTEAQMPAHTHTQNSHTHTQDAHTHTQDAHSHLTQRYPTATGASSGFTIDTSMSGTLADNTLPTKAATAVNQNATATNQAATATNQNAGSGAAHANLPPYIVVYMWKRTA